MREVFFHRPLALLAIGLVLGIATMSNWLLFVLLLLFCIFLRSVKGGLICAFGFAVGAALAPPPVSRIVFPRDWVDIQARVVSVPRSYPDEISATIESGSAKLQLGAPTSFHLGLGDVIHVKGDVKSLAVGSERLADRGIVGRIWADQLQVVRDAPWVYRVGQGWRDSFTRFVDDSLPKRAADVVSAVCFNEQSRLDEGTRESFSRSGTVHAIAASGLHVAVIAFVLFWLLSLAPIPRGAQIVAVALVLTLYVIASGINPPVVRAAIMSIVLASAYLLRREPDLLSAVGLAAVIEMLSDRTIIYDVGFQLTFVVLAAVALFPFYSSRALIPSRLKMLGAVWQKVGRYAVVFLAAAPLVAYQFGAVSLTSLVSNALLVIALPVLIIAALVAHLVSFVFVWLASICIATIVGPLAGWILFVTDKFGGEWASLTVPAFSGYWLLLVYGALLTMWKPKVRPV